MELSTLVYNLNKKINPQYWYELDPIYTRESNSLSKLIGKSNSIYRDIKIFPFNILISHNYLIYKESKSIILWINNKLFTSELNQLLQNRLPLRSTSEVRLRIATNMIYTHKNQYITPEEREEWAQWLHEIYWQRRKRIADYYFINILQLPF